jgi:CheY-like chemotaxis protein
MLFMDIQMPVMDGIEATHEIIDYGEDEEVPHVPIVALTANALKGDRERFLSAGMDEYITKPIETTELLYVLNKFLSDKAKTVITKTETETEEKPDTQRIKSDESPVEAILELDKSLETSKEELSVDEIELELPDESNKEKKILIAKKFLLERRVLTKVIENLGYDYEIVEETDKLEAELENGHYDILFTDAELVTDTLKAKSKNVEIVTDNHVKNEIEAIIKRHRG